jgi:hypothetical protein
MIEAELPLSVRRLATVALENALDSLATIALGGQDPGSQLKAIELLFKISGVDKASSPSLAKPPRIDFSTITPDEQDQLSKLLERVAQSTES